MAAKALPPEGYLRECVDYDEQSGVLTWRERPRHHFPTHKAWRIWNCRYAGSPCGHLSSEGYIVVKLNRGAYRASRVIWKIMTGIEPPPLVDHEDRNRANNAWSNLRSADDTQNALNRKIRDKTSSGRRGVSWHARTRKWAARVKMRGQEKWLGVFDTIDEAAAAYQDAARQLHGHFSVHE